MPRYRVHGKVTGTKYLGEFEATSARNAIQKALESDQASVNMCCECASECEDPQILDGEAELINESNY